MNDSTECALVRLKEDKSYVLLVRYQQTVDADTAYKSFLTNYMPDARETGVIETENKKWTICTRHKSMIVVVFDAPTKSQGMKSLDLIKRRLP